ncbi:MAG: Ig domain-containing protein, partial [Candidatus Nanoarchaeia archaeon]|nr:Ig domain-containing protein [Candidatus Jingweiarchaeum tengchongense]
MRKLLSIILAVTMVFSLVVVARVPTASAASGLTITPTTLPNATVNAPYSQTLTVSGGVAPYTWSITSGNLPPGLNLLPVGSDVYAKIITGTPTTAGTYNFTVAVSDSSSTPLTGSVSYTLVVSSGPTPPQPLTITTTSLPSGLLGVSYSYTLQASGGTTPYSWSATGLPSGLSCSSSGQISGTPTQSGTFTVSVTVTDSASPANTATKSLKLTIGSRISGLRTPSLDTGLPTYTFVDDSYITFNYLSPSSSTTLISVTLGSTSVPSSYIFSLGNGNFLVTIPLNLVQNEGVYNITVTDGSYTDTQKVYIKYKVSVTASPSPAYNQTSIISGTVSNAAGPVSSINLYLVNGQLGTGTAYGPIPVNNGFFVFSYNFPNRGTYNLCLSNTSGYAIYNTWNVGGNIIATNVLDPNPLYAMNSSDQESYLYLSYEDGTPVTGAAITLTSGVNPNFTATELGNGFYKFSGQTSSTAGNNYYTITAQGISVNYTLYFKPLSTVWNPIVKISGLGNNFKPGGTLTFTINYNPAANYQLNDYLTLITGPGKQYSSTGTFYIEYGGQIKVDVMANLWYPAGATDLTAKPVDVEQVFTVNPVVKGDQVTINPTKVNVGDTKDIVVTVKTPTGIERNNAKVVLKSSVQGMFSGPSTAVYTVSSDGTTVTLDASGTPNINIVGGQYVFAGLKFNHKGYISVEVTYSDSNGTYTTAKWIGTNSYNYGIRVYPKTVTLTSSVTQFTAGVAYPVVNISGAVAGLTGWTLYNPYFTDEIPSFSYVDNGDGSYVFNFSTVPYAFGKLTLSSYDTTGDIQYTVSFKVVMPTLKFISVHGDGLLTDSLPEKVVFQVIDPATGNPIIPSSVAFEPQHIVSSPMFDNEDALLNEEFDPGLVTAEVLSAGTYSYDYSTNTVTIKGLKATKGNPYVDYSVNPATLYLSFTTNGVTLWFMNVLKVVPATLTISPKNLTLYYGQDNMFSVKALDAHGAPIEGVSVYGMNPFQSYSTYLFGGITGANGVVAFTYKPNYIGEVDVVAPDLGLTTKNGTQITLQIVQAPPDTTPPTLTVTAPTDGSTVNTATVTVKGTATDNVGVVGVYVND